MDADAALLDHWLKGWDDRAWAGRISPRIVGLLIAAFLPSIAERLQKSQCDYDAVMECIRD
jgi:hypothetical protein